MNLEQEVEHKFAKHALHVNHDYLSGKRDETEMEAEASEFISHSVVFSGITEPEPETEIAVTPEETLINAADLPDSSDLTIPIPSQCYPDDLDLTEENFKSVCKEYMKTIKITEDDINTVQEKTRGQSSNFEWFKYRNGRLTASKFGEISKRRVTTPPDRLVRDLFQYKVRPNLPFQCKVGLEMEPVIISKYIEHQKRK
ncbi:hypothetical protein OS493_006741 [Desmophyllum pertusum]|uniref:Uncharacterized protein n=1 Tax=Desmophyllum pertusum TaxID=174260 RepID=A0A9X0D6J4_9CNID|nr:hypothetical protein OS493_006741 [Desmophyllum pertusum]